MAPTTRVPRAARGNKPEDVRRHTLGTLLGHVHESGPLRRTELAARMGLNRSTIGGLVAQLAELGLVGEAAPDGVQPRPGAGRPSLVVGPRPEAAHVVAVDIGVDRVVVALVGLGGEVLSRRQRRLSSSRSPGTVAGTILRLLDLMLPHATGRVVGVGVALPGVVRHADGLVRFAPNLGWVDEPLGAALRSHLRCLPQDVRIQVGNDADLGGLAEHLRGVAVGYDDVVFIAGEIGVGGGCIIAGRPLIGTGGYAGELGHLPLVPDGRACRCGARGCWETEIGGAAIARALGLADAGTDALRRAVRAEAETGGARLAQVAQFLGRGLAGLVNLLNPQMIVIGGLLGEVFAATSDVVRRALDASALTAPAEQVELVLPRLGADAVLVGASELAWEDLLADPVAALDVGAADSLRA